MDFEGGAFFASVVRPKSWYQFGKHSDSKVKQQQLSDCSVLFKRYSERLAAEVSKSPEGAFARLSRAPSGALSPRQAEQSKVQRYIVGNDGQCACTVMPGCSAIASHLLRVLPYVHSDQNYLLCFFGYLSNLHELCDMYSNGQIEDTGSATTSCVLALYQKTMDQKLSGTHTQREELLLSELQGQYAFFLYDSHNKHALAARDPSGEQELFWAVAEDDSVAFTNSLDQLPAGEKLGKWQEVPPGHYVSGRMPALHQFALTPEQLEVRVRQESANLGFLSSDEDSGDDSPKNHGPANLLAKLSSRKHA